MEAFCALFQSSAGNDEAEENLAPWAVFWRASSRVDFVSCFPHFWIQLSVACETTGLAVLLDRDQCLVIVVPACCRAKNYSQG